MPAVPGPRQALRSRPRIGVVKFASCDGCQLTLLDIENFDSLKRIELMVSVESAFRVRLKSSEMSKVEHVSTLIELLRAKLGDQKG